MDPAQGGHTGAHSRKHTATKREGLSCRAWFHASRWQRGQCRVQIVAHSQPQDEVLGSSASSLTPRIDEVTLGRLGCAARMHLGVDAETSPRAPTPTPTPQAWVAAIVRMQARHVPYWIAWHLLLGFACVLIYDNHRDDERRARAALAAAVGRFGAGRVRLIRWPGAGRQSAAYEDAMVRARREGVDFVAAIDADEFAAPFADGCMGPLLAACSRRPKCGGLSLNWRRAASSGGGTRVVDDAASSSSSSSFSSSSSSPSSSSSSSSPSSLSSSSSPMRAAGFDAGLPHPFLKTVARVKAHGRGTFLVHNNRPAAPFCLYGDDRRSPTGLRLLRGCRPSWSRSPPGGARAVVLHLHCGSLLEWVIRRSLRGRSDYVVTRDTCPTCGGSLEEIAEEWRQTCAARTPAEARGLARFAIAPPAKSNTPSPAAAGHDDRQRASAASNNTTLSALVEGFLRRMDRDVMAALAAVVVTS